MQTLRNRHTPEMRVMLRTLQIVALAGLVIGIVTLAKATAPYAEWRLMLYISWFAIAVISAEAILYWLKAGVHALLGMTLLVTLIELVSGSASLGGASLGLLMIVILVGYLYPLRNQFD
jgi:hypothetical protein